MSRHSSPRRQHRPNFKPIAADPSAAHVLEQFDAEAEWWLSAEGDYQTAAVHGMRADGSDLQELVALEWPARLNHGTSRRTIRLLISPEDVDGLIDVLGRTSAWLKAYRSMAGQGKTIGAIPPNAPGFGDWLTEEHLRGEHDQHGSSACGLCGWRAP